MRLIQISLVWLKKSPPFLEGFFNKLPQVISRILYEAIIYLSRWLPNAIKLPPHRGLTRGGTSHSPNKFTTTYVAFQHARFTPNQYYYWLPGALNSRFHPYLPEGRR